MYISNVNEFVARVRALKMSDCRFDYLDGYADAVAQVVSLADSMSMPTGLIDVDLFIEKLYEFDPSEWRWNPDPAAGFKHGYVNAIILIRGLEYECS